LHRKVFSLLLCFIYSHFYEYYQFPTGKNRSGKKSSENQTGNLVITCAAADDITAWCILAAVIAIVKAGSFKVHLCNLMAIAYVFLMIKIVRPFLKRIGDFRQESTINKPMVAIFF
jgi:Kef-type K+ transport system membrane component KefB